MNATDQRYRPVVKRISGHLMPEAYPRRGQCDLPGEVRLWHGVVPCAATNGLMIVRLEAGEIMARTGSLVFWLFVLLLPLAGCGAASDYSVRQRQTDLSFALGISKHAKLDAAASAFLDGTEECILDVRDRGITYEDSRNCAALQTLSMAYMAAGGDDPSGHEPTQIRLKGQKALKYVWMARAISELGGGMQNAWIW